MRTPVCTLILSLALALVFAPISRAELTPTCKFEERWLPVAAVKDGRIFCRDGDSQIEAPSDASWRLEGTLRDNTRFVKWSPSYKIVGSALAGNGTDKSANLTGSVSLKHDLSSTYTHGATSPFLEDWPAGLKHEGLVVFAWVVDGRITQVRAEALPATNSPDVRFYRTGRFRLSPSEEPGQAIVLVWMDGSFVRPAPNFKDVRVQQALEAMLAGDNATFIVELGKVADINQLSIRFGLLLHYAAEAGSVAATDVLLARGATVDLPTIPGKSTPLHMAAWNGRLAVVDRLLAAKAHKNVTDTEGRTPLYRAVMNHHDAIAHRLVEAHANMDLADDAERTPLILAINEGRADVARLLFSRGAKHDFDREQMEKVLITKVSLGQMEIVKLLLEIGVNANCSQEGTRPLIIAASRGNREMAEVLLKGKADPNTADGEGITALMNAATAGNGPVAEALLAAGADPQKRDKQRRTSLHLAAAQNSVEVVNLLLARGADLAASDAKKRTPLATALWFGAKEAVDALLAKGARIDHTTPAASAAMEGVLRNDSAAVLEVLLKDGWSVSAKLDGGWPIIRVAEIFKASACLAVLRASGADAAKEFSNVVVAARMLDAKPMLLANPMPDDPREGNEDYPEEDVVTDVLIDARGEVRFPRIVQAPDQRFARAVLEVIPSWRFTAPSRGGQSVATRIRIPVRFALSKSQAYDVAEVDELPKVIKKVVPDFPAAMTAQGYEAVSQDPPSGEITLQFVIGADGHPKDIRVLRSANPKLSLAAINALKQWRFTPGKRKGQSVETRLDQTFVFYLD